MRKLTPGCGVESKTSNTELTGQTHLSGNTSRDDDNLGSFKSKVKLVSCVASNLERGHGLRVRYE